MLCFELRVGASDAEGSADVERDLMRMYGRGCVCVCTFSRECTLTRAIYLTLKALVKHQQT